MSNDLTLYKSIASSPDCVNQLQTLGELWGKSKMFGCERAEQGVVLLTICMTESMTPTQVTRKYHIINGMLSRKAGSAASEFKRMGGKIKWLKTGMERMDPNADPLDRYAEGAFTLDGETVVVSFSMRDAVNAGYVKDNSNWVREPWKNLRARVITNAIPMLAPEIYFGDDDGDDSGDYKDVTPQGSFFAEAKQQEQEQPTNPRNENAKPKPKSEDIQDAEVIEPSHKPGSTRRTYEVRTSDPEPNNPAPGKVESGVAEEADSSSPKTTAKTATAATQSTLPGVDDTQSKPPPQSESPKLNQLQRKVKEIVGDHTEAALRFCREELGWDPNHIGLSALSDAECNQIIQYPEDFMNSVKAMEK